MKYVVFASFMNTSHFVHIFVDTPPPITKTYIMTNWDKHDPRTWKIPDGRSPSQLTDDDLSYFLGGTVVDVKFETNVENALVQFFHGVSMNIIPLQYLDRYFSSKERCSESWNS